MVYEIAAHLEGVETVCLTHSEQLQDYDLRWFGARFRRKVEQVDQIFGLSDRCGADENSRAG